MSGDINIVLIDDLGGHGKQIGLVRDELDDNYNIYVICPEEKEVGIEADEIYRVRRPAYPHNSILSKIWHSMVCSLQMLKIFMLDITIADAVTTAGAGIGAIGGYIAKLTSLGTAKVIFIESWSRVESKSTTGDLLEHIADLLFVQHEELTSEYDDAIYAGRLM